jgi:hypothetical protein
MQRILHILHCRLRESSGLGSNSCTIGLPSLKFFIFYWQTNNSRDKWGVPLVTNTGLTVRSSIIPVVVPSNHYLTLSFFMSRRNLLYTSNTLNIQQGLMDFPHRLIVSSTSGYSLWTLKEPLAHEWGLVNVVYWQTLTLPPKELFHLITEALLHLKGEVYPGANEILLKNNK